jgi:hypothetical protein
MSVPFRTFLLLGVAVGLLGGGYLFAPQPGAMTLPTPTPAPVAKAAAVAAPAPAAKPQATLVASRPPVPLVTRTHTTYFASSTTEAAKPADSAKPAEAAKPADTAADSTPPTQVAKATIPAEGADGGLPPGSGKGENDTKAKAAIELDGYKNVRGLEKGPDGVWRGRAMRGRTEIAIRVDATGSVSAD